MRGSKAIQNEIKKYETEDNKLTESLHVSNYINRPDRNEPQQSSVKILVERRKVREHLEQLREELKQVQQGQQGGVKHG